MGETLLILASGWLLQLFGWSVGVVCMHHYLYLNVEMGVPSGGWKSIATCYEIL